MPLFPSAQYVGPLPSSNYRTNGTPKMGTVVHVIVGSAESALNEFHDPSSQLSAHFIIAGPGDAWPDGHILQLLDTDLCAFAQATGNYPPTAYIAMEFSGYPTTAMSAAQMASGALIDAWASKLYGFPLIGPVAHGNPGCTTHCFPNGQPDPNWGDHSCPGLIRLAQVPEMIAQAVAINNPPIPPVTEDEDMPLYTVVDGTGYVIATDLSSKTGIPDAPDAKALIATGLYKQVTLTAQLVDSIPNA